MDLAAPFATADAMAKSDRVRAEHRQIDAPADTVWRILVDLDAWPRWGPTVAGANLDGGEFGLGATGRVWTPIGIPVPFVISDIDFGRSWGCHVAGVPATRHGVDPRDRGCRAWMSAPAYVPVLEIALRRIERIAVSAAEH